ncbi:hypothetical protein CYMTET_46486 [Cymbomonas tetramitiformis]|uniref:Uncharacterized protein n=1 Tax=Cymbomonas tetramitiformis TaxID=36881 RepID=A0AAE0BY22_9CHLO|nr:hypothetical protein CYMTET_46486 [Cymbomonas tetramitiformis]
MLNTWMQRMKDLNTQVEAAEEATAKVAGNSFPMRLANLATDMPQMFHLYGQDLRSPLDVHTLFDTLRLVLVLALLYLHNAIVYAERTMDWLEEPTWRRTLGERSYTAHNTRGRFRSSEQNGYTMIQLRGSMESDAAVHGGTEALRAKLTFIKQKVYAGTDGLVTDWS